MRAPLAVRRFRPRLLAGLAGLALAAPALANSIAVANGAVGIAADGVCSLAEAIANANDTGNGQPYPDCAAGDPAGADTIVLPHNGRFVLTTTMDTYYGNTGLPGITSQVAILGHGSIVERSPGRGCDLTVPGGPADFRLLLVARGAALELHNLRLRNGCANQFGTYSGGAILNFSHALSLSHVEITLSAATIGGAIMGQVNGSHVEVVANRARSQGGGIFGSSVHLADSLIEGNTSGFQGGGLEGSGVHLQRVQVIGNRAQRGGGILSQGSVTLDQCTVAENHATDGAGLYAWLGTTFVSSSLFTANVAARHGGGVFVSNSVLATNSTWSGNTAGNAGGGVYAEGKTEQPATATLSYCTLAGNHASSGGGVFVTFGFVRPKDTLIVGNSGGDCGLPFFGFGTLCSQDANFDSDGSCRVNGACGAATTTLFQTAADPGLGALAANGGPTWTRALLAGSPAIDAAAECTDWAGNPVATDQRGSERPQGSSCDAGAFERQ